MSILDFFQKKSDTPSNRASSFRRDVSNTINDRSLRAPASDFQLERAISTSRDRLRKARGQFNYEA